MNVSAAGRRHWAALRALLLLTVLLGLSYPAAVWAIAQLPGLRQHAAGSPVTAAGRVVGSSLIGQSFNTADGKPDPAYFQPRPSAAGDGYDPLASGASNLGSQNPELIDLIKQRRAEVAAFDGVAPSAVAPDALQASGSGLDPHISPAYAAEQVARVARTRQLGVDVVRRLVAESTTGRRVGFLGEPTVNVLLLNLALDREAGAPTR